MKYDITDIFDVGGNLVADAKYVRRHGHVRLYRNIAVDSITNIPKVHLRLLFDPNRYSYFRVGFSEQGNPVDIREYTFDEDGNPTGLVPHAIFPIGNPRGNLQWDLSRNGLSDWNTKVSGKVLHVGDPAWFEFDNLGIDAQVYIVYKPQSDLYIVRTREFESEPGDIVYKVQSEDWAPLEWYILNPCKYIAGGYYSTRVDLTPVKATDELNSAFERMLNYTHDALYLNVEDMRVYKPVMKAWFDLLDNHYILNPRQEK